MKILYTAFQCLALIIFTSCVSCSLLDKFSGEVRAHPLPFKPFTVNSNCLVFLNNNSVLDHKHYVIDTTIDKIIGAFQFKGNAGPISITGYPTLCSVVADNKIFVVTSVFENYPTREIWVIYPDKGTGQKIALTEEMPDEIHYFPINKKIILDHSLVYSSDKGGGNTATTIINADLESVEKVIYTWGGTHSMIEGQNSNIFCITGWYGPKIDLKQLLLSNYSMALIGTNLTVGESTGSLLEGSSICNPVSNRVLVTDYNNHIIRIYNAEICSQIDTIDLPYTNEYHPIWIRYFPALDYIITTHKWADTPRNTLITIHNQTTKALVYSFYVANGSDAFDIKNGKIYVYNYTCSPCTVTVYDMNSGFNLIKTIELK